MSGTAKYIMPFQMNEIPSVDDSPRKIYSKYKFALKTTQIVQIHPISQQVLAFYPFNDLPDGSVGIVEPNPRLERWTGLFMTGSVSEIIQNQTQIALLNCTTNLVT